MSSASCHFRADLVELTHQHLQFLLLVHAEGVSVRRPSVESLRRYTKLWLPLVAKFAASQDEEEGNVDNIELIPPPDIAWLWHCHRLSPTHYAHHLRSCNLMQHENVTEKNNSRVARQCYLDANPPFGVQTEYSTETPTRQLDTVHSMVVAVATIAKWVEAYPEEPFFLRSSSTAAADTATNEELNLDGDDVRLVSGYDLLASSERQSTFLWQVKQTNFSDDAFLQEGVKNYYRFLRLYPKARGLHRLVPTYQIDIIWHTHMISSLREYDEECISIMGCAFDHDDSLNDRSEGSSLEVAFRATSTLWEREYGEKYHVEGGMYRGEPPSSFFRPNADGIRTALEQSRNSPATAHLQAYTVSPPRNPVPLQSETFTRYTNHEIRCYKANSLFIGLLPICFGAATLSAGILGHRVGLTIFGTIILLIGAVLLSCSLLWIMGKLALSDDVIIKKLFGRDGRRFVGFVGGGGCGGGGCGGGCGG